MNVAINRPYPATKWLAFVASRNLGTRNKPGRRAGFSLVEVVLALAVAAFCLLILFALIPLGLKTDKASLEQTTANGILSAVNSDLRATPPTLPPGSAATSAEFAVPIPAAGGTANVIYYL